MKGILKTNKSTHCVTPSQNNRLKKQIKPKKPSSLPSTPSKEKCVTFENYSPPGVELICPKPSGLSGKMEKIIPQIVDKMVGETLTVPVRRLKSFQIVERERSIEPVERRNVRLRRNNIRKPSTVKLGSKNVNKELTDETKILNRSSRTNIKPLCKSKLTNHTFTPLKLTRNLEEKSLENWGVDKTNKVGNGEKTEQKRSLESGVERRASEKRNYFEESEDESGDNDNNNNNCFDEYRPEGKPSVIRINIVL
ncbi:uncharacterized protein LOC111050173 [Nilaparvata lugens]|uniref:uncharacterized protein LOC111050173 n=1 Tax=Nilaparvata lugens TaxID=108931 RepID=UPI00193E452D|nr:uncharacterized protein LOC111050173 [Nilaparvata lugens]